MRRTIRTTRSREINSRFAKLRFLLLQVRKSSDPMRGQEVVCFARAIDTTADRIEVFDLLAAVPTAPKLRAADVVLLGGSGDFYVSRPDPWLPNALESMRALHDTSHPTFASCWGFQALAQALGGNVVRDSSRAELGSEPLMVTEDGQTDPVFGGLGTSFDVFLGHEDVVESLPSDAVLLGSTARVRHQAFCFRDKPIYCTQFHPELTLATFLERVTAYSSYVEKIAGVPMPEFAARCRETPMANQLLPRFLECYL